MTKDLTAGYPIKRILLFAFPLYLGILFQQFYNIVDTVIVGQLLGVKALAGVGSTGSACFLILGFCNGICSGFSIPVARCFGAKQDSKMRRYVANSLWLSGFFAVILTTAVCILCRRILLLMHTPEDVFSYANRYLFIILTGIPVVILYNLEAGILRALGDSKTPLYFLIFSSVVNIGLNLLTIFAFHMNVEGPALATVFSQALSAILCAFYIRRKFAILRMEKGEATPSFPIMKELCGEGIPMGLQYSVTAIGSIILQTAMNGLGSNVVAGVTASMRIHAFLACPLEALGSTMAPYTGQNMGAEKFDRISKGTLSACLCGFAASAAILGIVLLIGKRLISIFLDVPDEDVIYHAYRFLLCTSGCYCFLTIVNVVRFSIQGMGFSSIAIISGVMEMIARSFVALILAPKFGFNALCFAHPLAWLMADLFLIPTFFICKKKITRRATAAYAST